MYHYRKKDEKVWPYVDYKAPHPLPYTLSEMCEVCNLTPKLMVDLLKEFDYLKRTQSINGELTMGASTFYRFHHEVYLRCQESPRFAEALKANRRRGR